MPAKPRTREAAQLADQSLQIADLSRQVERLAAAQKAKEHYLARVEEQRRKDHEENREALERIERLLTTIEKGAIEALLYIATGTGAINDLRQTIVDRLPAEDLGEPPQMRPLDLRLSVSTEQELVKKHAA